MIELVDSATVLGIAKKLNAEMEKHNLAAHAAILGTLNTLANLREQQMKLLEMQRQHELAEKAQEIGRKQQQFAEEERARQQAARVAKDAKVITLPEVDHNPPLIIHP